MPDWPSVKAKRLMAVMEKSGWLLIRCKGSHRRYFKEGYEPYTVAFHDGEEIGPVLLKKIARKTGLALDDFL